MNELTTINNKSFGTINIINMNGKIYAKGLDIATALGYSNKSKAVSTHCRNPIKIMVAYRKDNKEAKTQTTFIADEDIALLIQISKTKPAKYKANFKDWLISEGVMSNISIIESRKEIEFIHQLEETLEPFNVKGVRQYPVLNYRIDYYIESLNIAIEYDESNHKYYSYESQEGRQLEIEQELGCRFIRVSDNKTHNYNIGLVLKQIFMTS